VSLAGTSASAVDEAGAKAFRIVQKDLENVPRGKLGVALPHGEILGRLHEAARAFGVFLEIHFSHPSSGPPALSEARADPAMSDLRSEASAEA
jgi:hypothetical protein